jgi:predicted DNA-binding transcriptional regulator AlpA
MAEIIDIAERRSQEARNRYAPPTRVRSMREAAALAGVSIATLYRVIASGDGPRTVRMSPRFRGITDHDLADWLEARAR